MRKRVLFVLVAIALLACVLGALVACESYKATALKVVSDKNAVVESNGGLVVKQGDYLYFINGYADYLTDKGKDNWFGNVTKGAIVRVTYYEDGTLGDDPVIVVPKSVMASSENVGFSIFGEYIYYVSPSAEEDRTGKVQTDTLQFMRTKIDGTGTQVILNIDDTSVKYKYTSTALFYYKSEEKELYAKDLTAKSFKANKDGTLISDKVSSVYFPVNETYDPSKTETAIGDYVFYTKSSEDSYEYSNSLYVVSPAALTESKEVINPETYADGKYSISVIGASVEGDKLAIYYTKTSYVGTSSSGEVVGTYAYQFTSTAFSFNADNEKKLTSESLSSIFVLSYAEGVVVSGSSTKTALYHNDGTVDTFGDLKMDTLVAVTDTTFYYVKDNKLLFYNRDNASNAGLCYTEDKSTMTSFTGVEYFEGCLFLIVDDDYDYVYRLKVSTIDVADRDALVFERIGIVTDADNEKMEEEAKKDEEDE